MKHSPPLIAGRLSRNAISWLVAAVLLVTPIESLMVTTTSYYAMLIVRSVVLGLLLVALRTRRVGPIDAGRVFLAVGLASMVATAMITTATPDEIVIEAVAYGTTLSIFTLLIAPSATRRRWSSAVTALIIATAAIRLIPGEEALLVQLVVIFLVHTSAVLALDLHANRAEAAGAMATIDELTGLVNRRPAIEKMTAAILETVQDGDTSAAIMVDLDHFKRLNDTLGHEAGDDALRRAADALTGLVRSGDMVCRWGGEEFLILLSDTDSETAAGIAERMRIEIERLGITASFGVAQVDVGNTVAEWVDRADSAMYLAKHNGRNRVFVDDDLVEIHTREST